MTSPAAYLLRCAFAIAIALTLPLSATSLRADRVPEDLQLTSFSGPDITPSPACLCTSVDGVVFAGIDLNGSLGKGPGKGRIVRLVDEDKDGAADSHTVFTTIDNPRGLIAFGDKVWVLYTAFGGDGQSTGMNLAVLTDADQDGVADGPEEILIEGICAPAQINSRGTDHSTNGIRMGIDGWIYIAVGDFGFHNATDRDGTQLTLLGGGIVRVRPDGTEMELYTTGMRNIYDVAIDPFMNVFTRGNTNDGGGWNVRFVDHIQSAEYGYPRLFKNFADEILPALEDLGGGSGVGALFLSEPSWPELYNNQPLMADWGHKAVYLHRLSPDGATHLQKAEEFVQVSQVSDLDVDGSGQMFLSAWDGAGFKGDETKGYLVRVVPKDWKYEAAPDLAALELVGLVELLASDSATIRLAAQQELLSREGSEVAASAVSAFVKNDQRPLTVRVAALFTLAQLTDDPAALLEFCQDKAMREFALRAATDRLPRLLEAALPLEPFVTALNDGTERQKAAAAVALGRLGNLEAAQALLSVAYTKPELEGRVRSTQLETIKAAANSKLSLEVRPGETLFLSLGKSEGGADGSQLVFNDAHFLLADNKKVKLSDITPAEGESENVATGGKKKDTKVVITAPMVVAYPVPDSAVKFFSKITTADQAPEKSSVDFYMSTIRPGEGGPATSAPQAPRHATPNPGVVVPHLAARALIRLQAADASLNAVGTSSEDLALWVLSYLHEDKVVDGLLQKLAESKPGSPSHAKLLTVLSRLYQQEDAYLGDWWWSTRPDTRGPYYKPVTWSASAKIAKALQGEMTSADRATKTLLAGLNDSHRLGMEALGTLQSAAQAAEEMPTVDLAKIASKEGAVASTPIEDVILSLDKLKPDLKKGELLFTQQGCIACHALEEGGPVLGPYMGQIGSIMNVEQIGTAILRPNDTISQGFQTAQVTMKDGSVQMGFVTSSDADTIVLRDAAGQVKTLKTADVAKEEHLAVSMMPPGLANALSLEDFSSLVHFLASKKQ